MCALMTSYATHDVLCNPVIEMTDYAKRINPLLFGKLIAKRRKALHINQQEMARRIFKGSKLSNASAQSRMSRIESGKVKIGCDMVNRVAKILKIPVADIKKACAADPARPANRKIATLYFDPSIIDHLPTIENYIQIINTHLKTKNLKGVALGFQQLCEAANNFCCDHLAPESAPADNGT